MKKQFELNVALAKIVYPKAVNFEPDRTPSGVLVYGKPRNPVTEPPELARVDYVRDWNDLMPVLEQYNATVCMHNRTVRVRDEWTVNEVHDNETMQQTAVRCLLKALRGNNA